MTVGEIVEPMVVGESVSPMTVGEIVEPIVTGEIVEPMVVGEIVEPIVTGEIVEPMTVGVIVPAMGAIQFASNRDGVAGGAIQSRSNRDGVAEGAIQSRSSRDGVAEGASRSLSNRAGGEDLAIKSGSSLDGGGDLAIKSGSSLDGGGDAATQFRSSLAGAINSELPGLVEREGLRDRGVYDRLNVFPDLHAVVLCVVRVELQRNPPDKTLAIVGNPKNRRLDCIDRELVIVLFDFDNASLVVEDKNSPSKKFFNRVDVRGNLCFIEDHIALFVSVFLDKKWKGTGSIFNLSQARY